MTNTAHVETDADRRPAAGDEVRDELRHLSDTAGREARRLGDVAREELERFLAGQQAVVADMVSDLAEGIRSSAARPDVAAPAGVLNGVADTADTAAARIRSADIGRLGADLRHAAERQPLAVAVGAAAIGLVVARFLKSSDRR